jgi:hypothetical protein
VGEVGFDTAAIVMRSQRIFTGDITSIPLLYEYEL